uniref:NB-ARC domain-containing protein n=1 Tax=Fagus sylvatica TaxID=28930 RepID=A0A2N9GF56_FAGSY
MLMKESRKLESKLPTIQAILNDAEKRQVKEEAVKLWLEKLKDVYNKINNVLNEKKKKKKKKKKKLKLVLLRGGRVAKAIIESVEGQSPNMTTLQSLLDGICDKIGGKKFFLVLDDVWTEESTIWEPFRLALRNGAQGSRILVTTRKNRVAEMMRSAPMIDMGVLSNDHIESPS